MPDEDAGGGAGHIFWGELEIRSERSCRLQMSATSVLKVTTGSRNVEPDECNREDNALREDRDPVLHTPVLLLLFN